MKAFFFIFFVFSINPIFAKDPLLGKRFNHCDTESKYFDWDYFVEYMSGEEEFEAEVFRDKDSKGCKGSAQFAIGRIWKYEINDHELITTLKEVKVVLVQEKFIDIFNKKKICGVSSWKIDELVICEGSKVLGHEELPGYRTIHQFHLQGKELQLTSGEGGSFKLLLDPQ